MLGTKNRKYKLGVLYVFFVLWAYIRSEITRVRSKFGQSWYSVFFTASPPPQTWHRRCTFSFAIQRCVAILAAMAESFQRTFCKSALDALLLDAGWWGLRVVRGVRVVQGRSLPACRGAIPSLSQQPSVHSCSTCAIMPRPLAWLSSYPLFSRCWTAGAQGEQHEHVAEQQEHQSAAIRCSQYSARESGVMFHGSKLKVSPSYVGVPP